MSKQIEALKLALAALEASKRMHHYCEDTWYSCPKHEDGCANESEGDECNCGADEENAQLDKAITAIREALADQPAQQHDPYAVALAKYLLAREYNGATSFCVQILCEAVLKMDAATTSPPASKPLTFEQWLAMQHGDPEELGFLQALRIAYIAGQDSITKDQK